MASGSLVSNRKTPSPVGLFLYYISHTNHTTTTTTTTTTNTTTTTTTITTTTITTTFVAGLDVTATIIT